MVDSNSPNVLCVADTLEERDVLEQLIAEAIAWPTIAADAHSVGATDAAVIVTLNVTLRDDIARAVTARAVPWLAIGGHVRIPPTMWLPEAPKADLLRVLLTHLVPAVQAGPVWRRKSDMIIGHSPAIRQLLHTLDRLAPVQTPVIITGESGVGKELVAQALHYGSPRAKAAFVAINCAAIPETLFEAEFFGYQRGAFTGATQSRPGAFETADHGTLFLDEIGDLPLTMQAKLLRVLQTGEVQRIGSTEPRTVSFRLVSATNRDLEAAAKTGQFREDLFYRVNVLKITVPPLRERVSDIPRLALHFIKKHWRAPTPPPYLSQGALSRLVAYPWPGNIRELENEMERMLVLAGDAKELTAAMISQRVSGVVTSVVANSAPRTLRDVLASTEAEVIVAALGRHTGDRVAAATELGVSESFLDVRMTALGLGASGTAGGSGGAGGAA